MYRKLLTAKRLLEVNLKHLKNELEWAKGNDFDDLAMRRNGVVVRASASQSVDQGFIPLVESYQKTLKSDIRNFPAWRSAFRRCCGEQAGKFAYCVLGQGT